MLRGSAKLGFHFLMEGDMRSYRSKTRQEPIRPDSGKHLAGSAMVDHRDTAVSRRRLQELADQSPRHQALQEAVTQRRGNATGLPDKLKSGVERLSGHSLDDVKVHYNSSSPAQLHAHAYAQGNDIHIAPGQEQHLPHEAWHVVQQAQGRVTPTMQHEGKVPINDDEALEKEADVMGAQALQLSSDPHSRASVTAPLQRHSSSAPVQRYGALGQGNAGHVVLPAGTVLTHGTNVQQFLDAALLPQATPDAPAWFAMGSRFSAHAGSRGGDATTYLHNYNVTNNLNLVAFDDINDLSAYLQNAGHAATNVNGVAEANLVQLHNAGVHGYKLDRDTVRGELEIILFANGVAALQSLFRSQLDTVEEEQFHDDADIGRRRRLVGNGQVIHSSNPEDLADFQTAADDRITGRARSQSF